MFTHKIFSFRQLVHVVFVVAVTSTVIACGGSGGGNGKDKAAVPKTLSDEIRTLASDKGLVGNIAGDLEQQRPDTDPLLRLGRSLFFSRTLSGRIDVACASCHHPDLVGGDKLSLPVGTAARQPWILGPGRELDPASDLSPEADGGPNVGRRSPTIFNSALYDRALFLDGRVFVVDESTMAGGEGQRIRTPEGGNFADLAAGESLLSAQSKMPMADHNEMRAFTFNETPEPHRYRDRLMDRLRGRIDQYAMPKGSFLWQTRFAAAFGSETDLDVLITTARVQEALAAYQRSMIFVDSPWRRFLAGEDDALDEDALEGARLFLTDLDEGGLGCHSCHSGERFTDEQFYNTGFPQFGRGKRSDKRDFGRWEAAGVLYQREENRFAFRTPNLLNVGLLSPYGHVGAFSTLEELLAYHADPVGQYPLFDFSLSHLAQMRASGINGKQQYPLAADLTREVLEAASFQTALEKLPGPLTETQISALAAFLNALTDPCAADAACVADWVPGSDEDPDGNLLIRGQAFSSLDPDESPPDETPQNGGDPLPDPADEDVSGSVALAVPDLPARITFADAENCTKAPAPVANTGQTQFLRRETELGLTAIHGYALDTWMENVELGSFQTAETMQAGGITAAYLTGNCWPDLILDTGDGPDASGVVLYRNLGNQSGFEDVTRQFFVQVPQGPFTGVAVADMTGDYRRELVFGNLHQGEVPVYTQNVTGSYTTAASIAMPRNTYGIAFGDADGSGYPDMVLAHWSPVGVPGSAPVFWRNQSGQRLAPMDEHAGTTDDDIRQKATFSPGFADINDDGMQDLLIASDFSTSVVLQNEGDAAFRNVTVRNIIDDTNGMGSVLADLDNDGLLDWFVTSIYHDDGVVKDGQYAVASGNRLYWNRSSDGQTRFVNAGGGVGISDGGWGWAACGADFDHDGWQDIFMVNGYGVIPETFAETPLGDYRDLYLPFADVFGGQRALLYMNNGDGTFTESANDWYGAVSDTFPVSEGRGVVCVDYDRDGDVDIALLDHSRGIQFYENQTGNGSQRGFLSVRLVGLSPNTEALGAKVFVTADINSDGQAAETETQVRVSAANSNFVSQNTADLHFGLGSASQVTELRVVWPGETTDLVCRNLPVNRFMILHEGDARCDVEP